MVGSQSIFVLTGRGNGRSAAGRDACDDGEVRWGVGRLWEARDGNNVWTKWGNMMLDTKTSPRGQNTGNFA